MTKDKGFKQVVRRRMEKTGESYAAARAQLAPGAAPPSGKNPETWALARALARLGVANPFTGAPFSEEMLLGLGGGIGAAYWLMEWKDARRPFVTLYVGGVMNAYVSKRELLAAAGAGAGAALEAQTSTTPKAAEKQLRAALAAGAPAIVSVDAALVPGSWLPREMAGASPQSMLVELRGESPVLVGRERELAVSWADLGAMRAVPKSAKNRLTTVAAGTQAREPLAAAIRAGIELTLRGLRKPPMTNFGLPSLARWAEALTATRDKKGWPQVFAEGRRLQFPLRAMHASLEHGTGGGNFRAMYAGFLDEAAAALGRPALRPVAARYRKLAGAWSAMARRVLPFLPDDGAAAWPPDGAIDARRMPELLAALRADLDAIRAGEAEAADALGAAIP